MMCLHSALSPKTSTYSRQQPLTHAPPPLPLRRMTPPSLSLCPALPTTCDTHETMRPTSVDPRDADYRKALSHHASTPPHRLRYPPQSLHHLLEQARMSFRTSPPSTNSLFISGLNDNVTADYLFRTLKTVAPVRDVFVPDIRGAKLGLALIHLPASVNPSVFVNHFNNSKLAGQTMVVVPDCGGKAFTEALHRTYSNRPPYNPTAHRVPFASKAPIRNDPHLSHPLAHSSPPLDRNPSKLNIPSQYPSASSSSRHLQHSPHVSLRQHDFTPAPQPHSQRSAYRATNLRRVIRRPNHSSRHDSPYSFAAVKYATLTDTYTHRTVKSTGSLPHNDTALKSTRASFMLNGTSSNTLRSYTSYPAPETPRNGAVHTLNNSSSSSPTTRRISVRFSLYFRMSPFIKISDITLAYAGYKPRQCFKPGPRDCILTFSTKTDREDAYANPPSFVRERRIGVWPVDVPSGVSAKTALDHLFRRDKDMQSVGGHPKVNNFENEVSETLKEPLARPESETKASNSPRSIGLQEQKEGRGEICDKDELLTLQNSGEIDHADSTECDPSSVDVSFREQMLRETVFEDMMLKISQHLLVRRKQRFDAAVNKAIIQSVASSRHLAENKKSTTETAKSEESGVINSRCAEEQSFTSTHASLDNYLDIRDRTTAGPRPLSGKKEDGHRRDEESVNERLGAEKGIGLNSSAAVPANSAPSTDGAADGPRDSESDKYAEKVEKLHLAPRRKKSRFSCIVEAGTNELCEKGRTQPIVQGEVSKRGDCQQKEGIESCENDVNVHDMWKRATKSRIGSVAEPAESTGNRLVSSKRKCGKESEDELRSTSMNEVGAILKPRKRPRRESILQQCVSDVTPESSVGTTCGSEEHRLKAMEGEKSTQVVEDEQRIGKVGEKVVSSDTESEDAENTGQSARTAGYRREDWHRKEPQDVSMYHRQRGQSCHSSRDNRLQNRVFRKCISGINARQDLFNANSLKQRKKHVQFRKSGIHGMGLFACEAIEAGEFIIEYVGELIRWQVCNIREERYMRRGMGDSYLFRLNCNMVIDATQKGCIARFINHSCDPNIVARIISVDGQNRIVFYSKRHIRENEELTYDYKFDFEDDDQKIACLCGAYNCRKFLN